MKIIVECKIPTPTVPQIRIPEESTILCVGSVLDTKKRLVNRFLHFAKHICNKLLHSGVIACLTSRWGVIVAVLCYLALLKTFHSIAKILTSNSVGTISFFLGCNLDNNYGSNFITKKKICLVLPEKEISIHRN